MNSREKVLQEIQSLLKVCSEFVVQYKTSWIESNCLFIQMEFCSQSLKQVLEVKAQAFGRQSGQPLTPIEYFMSCEIMKEVLECVRYLHELEPKVIHRDLKPHNI